MRAWGLGLGLGFGLAVGAVGCSGPLKASGPFPLIIESGEAAEPEGSAIELRANVPRGEVLEVSLGTAPEPEPDSESGSLPASESQPAPVPDPPAAPPADGSFLEVLRGELAAGRGEAGLWREFVLALLDRVLDPGSPAPDPGSGPAEGSDSGPASEPEPESEPPEDPAAAPAARDRAELRELLNRDKGGFSPEEEAAAIESARYELGPDFDSWAPARQDGWIVACHFLSCGELVHATAASWEARWANAAGDLEYRLVGSLGRHRAGVIARWVRTGDHAAP